ncbi:MAG: hypothetical protein AAF737_00785 [Pseudomonadota bacterium]
MKTPTTSTLTWIAAAAIVTTSVAVPLSTPAYAQTIDMAVMWPQTQFPKEGAFTSPEAAKKLPGDGAGEGEFFLLKHRALSDKEPEAK